jgi:hypothetical protein
MLLLVDNGPVTSDPSRTFSSSAAMSEELTTVSIRPSPVGDWMANPTR